MNWISKTREFVPVVKQSTKDLKEQVRELSSMGTPTSEIALIVGKSKTRIYELLK